MNVNLKVVKFQFDFLKLIVRLYEAWEKDETEELQRLVAEMDASWKKINKHLLDAMNGSIIDLEGLGRIFNREGATQGDMRDDLIMAFGRIEKGANEIVAILSLQEE